MDHLDSVLLDKVIANDKIINASIYVTNTEEQCKDSRPSWRYDKRMQGSGDSQKMNAVILDIQLFQVLWSTYLLAILISRVILIIFNVSYHYRLA